MSRRSKKVVKAEEVCKLYVLLRSQPMLFSCHGSAYSQVTTNLVAMASGEMFWPQSHKISLKSTGVQWLGIN